MNQRQAEAHQHIADAVVVEKWLQKAARTGQVPSSQRRYEIMHAPETKAACIDAIASSMQRTQEARRQRKEKVSANG